MKKALRIIAIATGTVVVLTAVLLATGIMRIDHDASATGVSVGGDSSYLYLEKTPHGWDHGFQVVP